MNVLGITPRNFRRDKRALYHVRRLAADQAAELMEHSIERLETDAVTQTTGRRI